jgi:hypothetical protein
MVLKVWPHAGIDTVSKFKLENKCVYIIGTEVISVPYFRDGRPLEGRQKKMKCTFFRKSSRTLPPYYVVLCVCETYNPTNWWYLFNTFAPNTSLMQASRTQNCKRDKSEMQVDSLGPPRSSFLKLSKQEIPKM